ncbi:hypothetical protein GGR21_002003 [Dysgonomonas hofstadii]|uniref:Outer membrane protein beta-barrel domain-containing protein n=1 Tax=Dysgonomonas hofstadii TaxID=637886 RepID=A0A840CUD1_9BACT|nr:porin family protein [Dysgonomonas hofstadii]MBB4036102.1 hypothetical protein [Dysgonomonas hofstadii]
MPDWKDHNKLPDEFSNLIRQKIEDYRVPVDSECWSGIEQRLQPKGGKKSLWWVGGIAASIAILVAVLLFRPADQGGIVSPMISTVEHLNISLPEKQIEQETEEAIETIYPTSAKKTRIAENKQSRTEDKDKDNTDAIEKEIKETINLIDTVSLASIPDNTLNNASDNEPDGKKTDSTSDQNKTENKGSKKVSQPEKILLPKKSANSSNWLLAASVSSGGNNAASQAQTINNMPMRDYSNATDMTKEPVYMLSNSQIPENEFSDFDYSLPLSFGVTVRKDINNILGIETGLTYTYLSTTMKKAGTPQYQAKQEIHYLGVPLNLVVYLWNNPKWNVYLSAGGMLEKGLKGIYTQDMYLNGQKADDTRIKGSVDGVQWSLNASAGASYSFYQGWGLYVEPRISYFFDNDQPISIRTEKSTVFGLGAGFRYKF